jgi:SAM-dependent methyltransferase
MLRVVEAVTAEPTIGDAFGDALLAALEHGASLAVVERSDGYVDVDSGQDNYFNEPAAWSDRCRWLLDRALGRVLDIGAGAGRAALALQDRGQAVVALDVSAGAVQVCERRGVRDCFLGTVDELARTDPMPFDSFLLLGNNLGLLESESRAGEFLGVLARLGHQDSVVVASALDPHQTIDPRHLRYHEQNRRRGRLPGQVTIRVRYRDVATGWFDYLHLSRHELAVLSEPAGWTIEEVLPGTLYGVVLRRSPTMT